MDRKKEKSSLEESVQQSRNTNGRIGELLVELELTKRGWHVERLDGSSKAVNGDLVAIRGRSRIVIQVKTNGTQKQRAYLGHAGNYLSGRGNFFNGKQAVISADFVVCVSNPLGKPVFHIFTVEDAENHARNHAAEWIEVPTQKGTKRSINFPVSPKHEEITKYHDAWETLD